MSPKVSAGQRVAIWLVAAIRTLSALALLCADPSGGSGASQQALDLRAFDKAIAAGTHAKDSAHFTEALQDFARAERWARDAGDADRQAIASIWVGVCDIHLFRYRDAVTSMRQAAASAERVGDEERVAVAALNLANIYDRLGDFALAEREQRSAIRSLAHSTHGDRVAQAWVQYSFIQIAQGNVSGAEQSFRHALLVAQGLKLPAVEALAWDLRGVALLQESRVTEAEHALRRAYYLRQRLRDADGISVSTRHLAELEFKKGENQAALRDLDRARASAGPTFKTTPEQYLIHLRGQILLALGRKSEAVSEFRHAVDSANKWRESAMPGDASSTQTVAYMHDIYQDYAELAADLSLERHDGTLARLALEALADNRAASLREQLTVAFSRNSQLPEKYFELLSELQEAQGRVTLGQNSAKDEEKLRNIRLELSDFENGIGLKSEIFSAAKERNGLQNSLRDIQRRLGPSEVLLSFCLGKKQSFVWTVTGDEVNLYRLPPEHQIATSAQAFSEAVRSGRNAGGVANQLSQDLLGKISPAVWGKRDWLITADGALLEGIPFAVLPQPAAGRAGQPLIANRTLRSLPTELLLLGKKPNKPENRFVGVADPIYNLADARRLRGVTLVKTASYRSQVTLGRLAGSDREIRAAAQQSGIRDIQLLTGTEASSASLRSALARSPEILHFAVHVVSPAGQPGEAALALSLTSENIPELLTREAIASYRVPGSLVVMSGCSSDQGSNLPSAGVIGLSRAWLLAGASAVLVSHWPTPDDSGPFFSAFYHHLQSITSDSLSSRAAAALAQAQTDMQQSRTYRNSPSFWAAYSLVSKE